MKLSAFRDKYNISDLLIKVRVRATWSYPTQSTLALLANKFPRKIPGTVRTWNDLENAQTIFYCVTWVKCSIRPTRGLFIFTEKGFPPKDFLIMSKWRNGQNMKGEKIKGRSFFLAELRQITCFRTFNTIFPPEWKICAPDRWALNSLAFFPATKVQLWPSWKYFSVSISADYAAYEGGMCTRKKENTKGPVCEIQFLTFSIYIRTSFGHILSVSRHTCVVYHNNLCKSLPSQGVFPFSTNIQLQRCLQIIIIILPGT